jgi:phospho-N-acetylmuramoyl-pentapeptide-transferase
MLPHFLLPYVTDYHAFALRATLGCLSTFLSILIGGYWGIGLLQYCCRSKVRPDTPKHHQRKNDTPTMGGLLILGAVLINAILWSDIRNRYVAILLCCILMFSLLGAWDDWCKIKYRKGISAHAKFVMQLICASITVALWFHYVHPVTTILLPFTHGMQIYLGACTFFAWSVFVLVATSNAVNITDGLDGLATGSLIPNFACATFLAYWSSCTHFVDATDSTELMIVGALFVGALLGFLWYNKHPAKLFMGDVGSIGLGAALACMMLMLRCELLLIMTGIVFVLETASVILQVAWYKTYRTRLFKMAPAHHHLELTGWHEKEITLWFTVVSCVLSGIVTLYMCKQ